MKKLIKFVFISTCLFFLAIVASIFFIPNNEIDANTRYAEEHPSFIIEGDKPEDVEFAIYVDYFGRGETCPGWSWNAGEGKVHDGIYNGEFKFTQNLATEPNRYRFKLPYSEMEPEKGCFAHLSQINFIPKNKVDTNGFGELVFHDTKKSIRKKNIDFNDVIIADNCGYYGRGEKRTLNDKFSCDFYIDKKAIFKGTSKLNIYFDFSELNENTVIQYNIYKGDYYITSLDSEVSEQ